MDLLLLLRWYADSLELVPPGKRRESGVKSKSVKVINENDFPKEELLEAYEESLFTEYKSKDRVV